MRPLFYGTCRRKSQWLSCAAYRIKFWNCNLVLMINSWPASGRIIPLSSGRSKMGSLSILVSPKAPSHCSNGATSTQQSILSTLPIRSWPATRIRWSSTSWSSISPQCSISFPANHASCPTQASYETTTSLWSMAICSSQVLRVERSVSSALARRCTGPPCPWPQMVSSADASTKTCYSSEVVIPKSVKSILRVASGHWLTKPSSIPESCLWTCLMTNKN